MSEADRLAKALEAGERSGMWYPSMEAAAELRRLSAELAALKKAQGVPDGWRDEVSAIERIASTAMHQNVKDQRNILEDIAERLSAMLASAPPAPQAIPPELDVRTILLAIEPGADGMGEEVYAKSVADVEAKLTAMGQELEEWQLGIKRLPAPQAEPAPAGSGGWEAHAKALEHELAYWKQRAQTMHEHQKGECWYWQGDGNDHPESMVNSLPVVIRADALRALMAPQASVVQQEPLGFISPKQVERIVDPDGEFGAYIPMRKTPAGNFTLAVYTHPAPQALTTCNCRWDGETQVQQCTLHEAHVDAIHEWAERAKTAEAKLLAPQAKPQPLTSDQKWDMWTAATIEQPSARGCYFRGVEDAEHAHGITKE